MKKQAGQTLLEILLAFSILIITLGAIVFGVTTALSNAQYAKNQNLANFYAQQGMAVVRQLRDSNWGNFLLENDGNYCLNQGAVDLTAFGSPPIPCGMNVGDVLETKRIFSREVKLNHNNIDDCCPNDTNTCDSSVAGSKVTVKVSWTDGKCSAGACHKVELISCFFNIDKKGI